MVNIKENIKKNYIKLVYSLILSFLLMMFFSEASFLYPMNTWVDVNCFFTMGRSLINGKIIYKDLFEHKGPIVYFLYGLIAFISEKSFIGMFIVEVIEFALFIYYSIKIMDMYIDNEIICYLGITIVSFLSVISPAWVLGGSVEEMNLFCLSLSLYLLLKNIRSKKLITKKNAVIIGFFAGISLWTKFTISGFYFGLVFFVVLYYIDNKYGIKDLLNISLYFILGFFIQTFLTWIYFIINDALLDMLEIYIYDNLFAYNLTYIGLYNSTSLSSIWTQLSTFITNTWDSIIVNKSFNVLTIIGILYLIVKYKKHKNESLLVLSSYFWLLFSTFIGGQTFVYYGFTFCLYAIFGIVAINECFAKNQKVMITTLAVSLLIVVISSFLWHVNYEFMQTKKEDMPQFKFAKIINTEKNATLMNYHFLDGGFYYASGIIPNNKYFADFSIDIDDINIVTDNMIKNKEFDYIVTANEELKNNDYTNISIESFGDNKYYLYKLNN